MRTMRGERIAGCCARAASGPRRRTAEQGDELAPFQLIKLHSIPAKQGRRITGYRIAGD
jgi:hypothetical protein